MPSMYLHGALKSYSSEIDVAGNSCQENGNISLGDVVSENGSVQPDNCVLSENYVCKPPKFQRGVLRTNCIDCLDRTNVAQYAYGLIGLGHQLHALGFIDVPKIGLEAPLSDDLMEFYETMGDTLAHQYGGSAAHNKIFSERRGQWKATTHSQEFFRTLQRYYSNAYMDAEKQNAINVFLGYFQPEDGKPAVWELESDRQLGIGSFSNGARLFFKRSLSDGNILCEDKIPVSRTNVGQNKLSNSELAEKTAQPGANKGLCDSSPEISTSEIEVTYSRFTPSMASQLFADTQTERFLESDQIYLIKNGAGDSNFLDLDWLSSDENLCEEETFERSALCSSPAAGQSAKHFANGLIVEIPPRPPRSNGSGIKDKRQSDRKSSMDGVGSSDLDGFSEGFAEWVSQDTLWH